MSGPGNGRSYDFVVVGAGIVGLTTARELARRGAGTVVVLEKEDRVGRHSSGRNSGVLHAGIYYGADTLKARVCAEGARRLRLYAEEHGIACRRNGKVIVATSPETQPQIDVLLERGRTNGIRVEKISPDELREIEPEAHTHGWALHSPDTAVIDSRGVLDALRRELAEAGVEVRLDSEVRELHPGSARLTTRRDSLSYGYLVNTAGLHADTLAHSLGVGNEYEILPFKGIYRKMRPEAAARFRGSIYPAPDLRVPFLGIHITPGVDGTTLIGPTAIPAFGRENYGWVRGLRPRPAVRMLTLLSQMFVRNHGGFRRMVREELGRYRPSSFLAATRALAPNVTASDILASGKVGLRAQLVHRPTLALVMDFVIERAERSLHVLNAVSPAFTSSLRLAELIVDEVEAAVGGTTQPSMR